MNDNTKNTPKFNPFNKPQSNPPKLTPLKRNLILAGCIALLFLSFSSLNKPKEPVEVPISKVITQINDGLVKSILMNDELHKVTVELKDKTLEQAGYPITYGKDLSALISSNELIEFKGTIGRPASFLTSFLGIFGPVILILLFLFFLTRKSGGLGIGGLGSKKTTPVEVPATRFNDIAGVDECVDELREVVDILKNPEHFTSTGAKLPKGYLLVGAPGTGKTMLARAVAGEAGVPFYSLSGSDFVEIFVGAGAKRVREIFAKARENEQAIVFIDEIDAIGRSRGGSFGAANDERENTLNQLLVEMDGFSASGVIMIAATNRADVLDEALTRAGRFDRKITVPVPDKGGRERIFMIHSKGKQMAKDIDYPGFAKRTPGMTGADIAQMLNEAALEAARRGAKEITNEDISSALATTALGRERKTAVVTERDREIVAWHEAGHTVAALIQKDTDNPISVSIVPRGPAGGVTWLGGSEDQFMTKTQAKARLVVSMAGRAAEEMLLDGDFTQGAHGDLQGATHLATVMVTQFGMGKNMISLDMDRSMGSSLDIINEEVSTLLTQALVTARQLVLKNQKLLREIVLELLEKENLTLEEILLIQNKNSNSAVKKVALSKTKKTTTEKSKPKTNAKPSVKAKTITKKK
jgi:cell division protease FtsH